MNKIISIIIPVYNAEENLKRCLESVTNQTYSNIEILIINDGSTDTTIKICEEYAKKDKRIRIINKKNEGVSIARNTGIKNAGGDYLLFIDSDDWIELQTCEELNKIVSKCDYDSICFRNTFHNEHTVKKDFWKERKEKDIVKSLFYEIENENSSISSAVYIWNKLYNKESIIKNKIYFDEELKYGEDLLFNYAFFSENKKVYYLDKLLYNYYINNTSVTHKYDKNFAHQQLLLLEKLKSKLKKDEKLDYYYWSVKIIEKTLDAGFMNISDRNIFKINYKILEIKNYFKNEIFTEIIDNVPYKDISKRRLKIINYIKKNKYFRLYLYLIFSKGIHFTINKIKK